MGHVRQDRRRARRFRFRRPARISSDGSLIRRSTTWRSTTPSAATCTEAFASDPIVGAVREPPVRILIGLGVYRRSPLFVPSSMQGAVLLCPEVSGALVLSS